MAIAAISGQHGITAPSGTVSSASFAFTNTITSGNAVTVQIGWNNHTTTLSTLTDDKGNIYTKLGATHDDTATVLRMEHWVATNLTNAPKTIQCAWSGAITPSLCCQEWSGMALSPDDGGSSTCNTASAAGSQSTNATSGNFTPTVDGDLIIGWLGNWDSVTSFSTGAGYTMLDTQTDGNTHLPTAVEYQIQGTAGSTNAKININAASGNAQWLLCAQAFKAAVAGTAVSNPYSFLLTGMQ